MKLRRIFFTVVGASLMLGACAGPGDGRSLDDIKNPTTVDSISNLWGQMFAVDYWRAAQGDSIAMSREARDQYLKGVADALKLAGKDDAYIEGYIQGLQMVQHSENYKDDMGIKIDLNETLKGIAYGLRSDSTVDVNKVNQDLTFITTREAQKLDEKEKAESTKELDKYAKSKGLNKLTPELYGKITSEGNGTALKEGDLISCHITVTDSKGKQIALPLPRELEVSSSLANTPLGQAVLRLKDGGQGDFASTGFNILGKNARQFQVSPNEILLFHVTVQKGASGSNEPAKPVQTDTLKH